VWEGRAALHHAQLAESINGGSVPVQTTLSGLAAAGLSPEQALAQINQLVNQQAFMLGANDIFWVSAVLFLALIPLVWLTKPQRGGPGGEAAAGAH
jgi:DHA2 family multidrug resistance protein